MLFVKNCARLLLVFVFLSLVSAAYAAPGVPSTIKWVYVLGHTHLDIGFTEPPETVAAKQKTMIDGQIAYAQTRPTYKWNIEATWTLEQWMKRSSSLEIFSFRLLEIGGQFGVSGAHSTMHSAKLGFEQVPRLLWNARRFRHLYNYTIETVFHDDVPGVAWTYPQILARSGIKYLVCGENLFIGGGFTQPYDSYPFYWKGPDGSRVLTWSARNGYTEGFSDYGLPWISNTPVDQPKLEEALTNLTNQGYPYDAVVVQQAFDNASITVHYNAIQTWNANNDNPKFILARPEEFFEYLVANYDSQIPEHSGNWTSLWDGGSMTEPKSEKMVKNAQDEVLATEKMWAVASELGLGTYPHAEFTNAWDMMVTVDEHSGGGGGWSGYFTQEQVDDNSEQHYGYALSASASAALTRASAEQALLDAMAAPDGDSIVVFNPLSWSRTDSVRVALPSALFESEFTLEDSEGNVLYQKIPQTGEIVFVADHVPSVGFKRFRIVSGSPPSASSSLSVGGQTIENSRYRIVVNAHGHVTSFQDKTASRELVNTGSSLNFNRVVVATNLEHFFGAHRAVPDSASTTITVGMTGPVAASLTIENASHPLRAVEIVLYDQLDRVDLVNTVDREQMEYAPLDVNSIYYALTYPLQLTGHKVKIDTAAGWLDPATQSLPGSYRGSHCIQHALDVSESGYGVVFATPDVYTHSFGNMQTTWGSTTVTDPAIFSKFTRYGDEVELKGGSIGQANPEIGSPQQWDLHYSFRAHQTGFDPVREGRFGWEVCSPMIARLIPAGEGEISGASASFLSVDQQGIVLACLKKADFGTGLILKMHELSGTDHPLVTVRSQQFGFSQVTETTPLEENIQTIFLAPEGSEPNWFETSVAAHEIRTFRLDVVSSPVSSVPIWITY